MPKIATPQESRGVLLTFLLISTLLPRPLRPVAQGLLLSENPAQEQNTNQAHGTASAAEAEDIFDRLVVLLEVIPKRWQDIPAPFVPISGRIPEDLLIGLSKEEVHKSLQRFARFMATAHKDRKSLIAEEAKSRVFTEVDLWLPQFVVQGQRATNATEAASVLEGWFEWAEDLGRKDALRSAAWLAMAMLQPRLGTAKVLELFRPWRVLPMAAPGREQDEALALVVYGRKLSEGGELDGALDVFRRARMLFHGLGRGREEGKTLVLEADLLRSSGKYADALDAYHRARGLLESVGDQLAQGDSWYGEGLCLLLQSDLTKAREAFSHARQLFQAFGDLPKQGQAWRGEAEMLWALGQNEKALEAYRKAEAIFEETHDRAEQGKTATSEGDFFLSLGEHQRALNAYRAARLFFEEIEDQNGEANTWQGEGNALFHLDDNDSALRAYRRGQELFKTVGNSLGQGNAWRGEADIRLASGEVEEAFEAYQNAQHLAVEVGDRLGVGNALLGEARVMIRKRDWKAGVEAATGAIKEFQARRAERNQMVALIVEASAEHGAGDDLAASRSAIEAIGLHSKWRRKLITDRQRTSQEDAIGQAYEILIPLLARQTGKVTEALRLAEEARSQVLRDLLATGPSRGEIQDVAHFTAERRQLEAEGWQIEDQLRRAQQPEQQAELQLQRRQNDLDLEWNYYLRAAVANEPLLVAPTLGVAAIEQLSRAAGPMLLYHVTESEVWGFLVRPGEPEIFAQSIPLARDDLGRRVHDLAHDLANPLYETRAGTQARQLWDLLIAPFAAKIPPGGRLIVVPHGYLHELPFEALLDPEQKPLFGHWQVSITPSAAALQFARRGHSSPGPNDLFVAFSTGGGLTLPTEEVAGVAGFFTANGAIFDKTKATYANYERIASRARQLLIATRGIYSEGSRTDTYLEIEPSGHRHNGRLSAAEVATIHLKAELVTLAACDTSYGRALLSDERLDMTRAFLIAGASAVLSTRWKIPEDRVTSRFLRDFYRAYRKGGVHGRGLRKDEALTEARRLAHERGDPAQVWASWALIGDAR